MSFVDKSYKSVDAPATVTHKSSLRMNTISYGVCYLKSPVTGEKVKINCIRDSCASESTCHMGVARLLGCEGPKMTRTTQGIGGCTWVTEVMTAMITLESLDGKHSQTFPLNFAEKPCGDLKFLDWRDFIGNHPQFSAISKELPEPAPAQGDLCEVNLILGTDHPDLILRPDESGPGPAFIGGEGYCKPFALRTVLGWAVCGFTGPQPPNPLEVVNGRTILAQYSVSFVNNANGMESTLSRVRIGL